MSITLPWGKGSLVNNNYSSHLDHNLLIKSNIVNNSTPKVYGLFNML